jgi:chromatin segregation and condensation protein Rec8/ScpA/Scc1 (kleisin family)
MYNDSPSFYKNSNSPLEIIFAPSSQLNIKNLNEIIIKVINNLPKFEKVVKASIKKIISLEDMINRLVDRVNKNINISFKDFATKHNLAVGREHKINIIVSFLALLELVKEGMIDAIQSNHYEDIEMQGKNTDIPNYS